MQSSTLASYSQGGHFLALAFGFLHPAHFKIICADNRISTSACIHVRPYTGTRPDTHACSGVSAQTVTQLFLGLQDTGKGPQTCLPLSFTSKSNLASRFATHQPCLPSCSHAILILHRGIYFANKIYTCLLARIAQTFSDGQEADEHSLVLCQPCLAPSHEAAVAALISEDHSLCSPQLTCMHFVSGWT